MAGRVALWSLAAAVVAAAGCGGGPKVDAGKAERLVRRALEGPPPSSVDCPKGVDRKSGRKLGCTVIFPDGTSATVTVHVLSDSGRMTVSAADFHPHRE